jgi:hypothetical protein
VVGTAHYGKFLPVVSKALGVAESAIEQHPILKALEVLPTRLSVADNSKSVVAALISGKAVKKTTTKTIKVGSSASSATVTKAPVPAGCPGWRGSLPKASSPYAVASLVAAAAAVAFFVVKRSSQ